MATLPLGQVLSAQTPPMNTPNEVFDIQQPNKFKNNLGSGPNTYQKNGA